MGTMPYRACPVDTPPDVSTLYSMRTHIARWGNSLALRLPKSMTTSLRLQEGAAIEIIETETGIVLQPVKKQHSLKALLMELRPEQLHKDVGTGAARGNEIW